MKPLSKDTVKRFSVNAGYSDFGRALIRRGWIESRGGPEELLDLKFTLATGDADYHCMKRNATINHNRGEGCLTCKTDLVDTLTDA